MNFWHFGSLLLLVIICDLLDDCAASVEDTGTKGGELDEVDEVVDRVSGLGHEGVGHVLRPPELHLLPGHTPGHQARQCSQRAVMSQLKLKYRIFNMLSFSNLDLKRTDMLSMENR